MLAFGANLLKLHPEIIMADGSMDVGRKYRGGPEKYITEYVKGRVDGRDDINKSLVFVTHSKADPANVEKVMGMMRDYGFENVIETNASSTISSHCGPGTLGVIFVKSENK